MRTLVIEHHANQFLIRKYAQSWPAGSSFRYEPATWNGENVRLLSGVYDSGRSYEGIMVCEEDRLSAMDLSQAWINGEDNEVEIVRQEYFKPCPPMEDPRANEVAFSD